MQLGNFYLGQWKKTESQMGFRGQTDLYGKELSSKSKEYTNLNGPRSHWHGHEQHK